MSVKTKRSAKKVSHTTTRSRGRVAHVKRARSAASRARRHTAPSWLFGTGLALVVVAAGIALARPSLLPLAGAAASGTANSSQTTPSSQQQKLQKIIADGDATIAKRLQGLSDLVTQVNGSMKLSSSDKAALVGELNTETTGLNTLKKKLDAETSITAAQADVASLDIEFKVYSFLVPKVHIIIAADWQQIIEGNLVDLAAKLQTRINGSSLQSKLQPVLDDMTKQTAAAQQLSSAVETGVLALHGADFVNDHNVFVSYLGQLDQAQTDSKAANSDAQTIVNALKGSGGGGGGGPCVHTGVSGSSGHYTFAPLSVNAQGTVVEANNPTCTVHLLGANEGWFTAGTTGDPVQFKANMDFLTGHLKYNIIRLAINSRWLQDNPPDVSWGALYRTALNDLITTAEQHGLYVELDIDSQFVLPPCDNQHPQCSQANQGAQDWDTKGNKYYQDMTGQELSSYQPTATWALGYLAATYKNDPAILFDVWNEPANAETKMPVPNSNPPRRAPISEATFYQDMKDRVDAVENVTQNHVVIVYERALSDMMPPSKFPVFTEKNIMYDSHIYHANFKVTNLTNAIAFAHSHGQAYVIGEWGGTPGQPDPTVLMPLLRANNVNATYFGAQDLSDGKNPTDLNKIGQAVNAQYTLTFSQ